MKITKSQLQKIIKEELTAELTESEGLSDKALRKVEAILDMTGLDTEGQVALRLKDLKNFLETGRELSQESLGEEADRTAKGNITQAAREKYATVGKDGFPILDKESSESAIKLRGHAPEADRAKIINKAAKRAPAAAKKAREEDKEKNEGRRITKSALLNIIREEMQSLSEEEDDGGPDRDWIVSYNFPLINGKSQPATEHVVAPTPKAAKEKAAEQVKEKVAKNPRAKGPATGFSAHEN
tara:strand:+ start:138 stop:860 length:723 start_codon:yes stop_codon:yes gene_type:complete